MKRRLLLIAAILALILPGDLLQADFIQCLGEAVCPGTINADLINGTPLWDTLEGEEDDDVLFGNGGPDSLFGQQNSDLMFGGAGSDMLDGDEENDHFFPGADDGEYSQYAYGQDGNDAFYSFAGETSTCLFIEGNNDHDVTNLIGFGPYSALHPFGQTGWVDGWIVVVDPIAGGNVLIEVDEDDDSGVEVINGLPSPNVAIMDQEAAEALNCPTPHPDINF